MRFSCAIGMTFFRDTNDPDEVKEENNNHLYGKKINDIFDPCPFYLRY